MPTPVQAAAGPTFLLRTDGLPFTGLVLPPIEYARRRQGLLDFGISRVGSWEPTPTPSRGLTEATRSAGTGRMTSQPGPSEPRWTGPGLPCRHQARGIVESRSGPCRRKNGEARDPFGPRASGGWRRPTLPPSLNGSTIGAAGLNGRVRNGNGCGPCALVVSRLCGRAAN